MKIMLFVDYDNFRNAVLRTGKNRQAKVSRLAAFLMKYISETLNWKKYNPEFIRSYIYTGEYADTTIQGIKSHLERETDTTEKVAIQKVLEDSIRRAAGQKHFFEQAIDFDFLELRVKPLQYSRQGKKIFQKGVDVQIAVDLLHYTHNDRYDVAILCSGDVDLIESIKMVKNMGKKLIVMSHHSIMSKNIHRIADHIIGIESLSENELDEFSYIPENHPDNKNQKPNDGI